MINWIKSLFAKPAIKLDRQYIVEIMTKNNGRTNAPDPIYSGLLIIGNRIDGQIISELSHDTIRTITVEQMADMTTSDIVELASIGWVIDNNRLSYIINSFEDR